MKNIMYKLIIFLLGLMGNSASAQYITGPTEFCPPSNTIGGLYSLLGACSSASNINWELDYPSPGVTIVGSNPVSITWSPVSGETEGKIKVTYDCTDTDGNVTEEEVSLNVSVLYINQPIINSSSVVELTCDETTFTVNLGTQAGSSATYSVSHPSCFSYTYNNYKFNFTTDNSASGEICITLNQPNCGTSIEQCITVTRECEDNLTFSSTSPIDNDYNSVNRYIAASDASTASFSDLEFKAGKGILLQPGFSSNQSFLAHIGPCSCAPVSGGGCFYQKNAESIPADDPQNTKEETKEGIDLFSTIDVENNRFVIYPNPSEGVFTIRFEEEPENAVIQIFDVMGKLRKSILNKNSVQIIDVSELENGVYIVVVAGKETLFKEKLVISK
jgi:hypothetical protein